MCLKEEAAADDGQCHSCIIALWANVTHFHSYSERGLWGGGCGRSLFPWRRTNLLKASYKMTGVPVADMERKDTKTTVLITPRCSEEHIYIMNMSTADR